MNNHISLNNYNYKIIDLTHLVSKDSPTYEGNPGLNIKVVLDYQDCTTETKFRVQQFCLNAGIGTHIDSPSHCVSGGKDISEIDLDQLILPIYCLNISDKINQGNCNYFLTESDILEFEKNFETVKPNSLFILYTGWSKNWPNSKDYRNQDIDGRMHFPGFSLEAANLLIKRGVSGIAIDTLSPDGADINQPVHQAILGAQKYIIENIVNCDKVSPLGATAIVAPLKIKDGTESPIRIFAINKI